MEMKADLLLKVNQLLSDDEAVVRLSKYANRLYKQCTQNKLAEAEELMPYTLKELDARIAEAEADFDAGRGIPSEEMHCHMKAFIANL